MAKKYEELTFCDDFMFCKILEQNPALCRELLELILDRKVGELACVNRQKPIEITANGKGVRFDVYAEGSDSVIYDIEMQNAVSDSIAKRSRYSQGMIDLSLIDRGAHYSDTFTNELENEVKKARDHIKWRTEYMTFLEQLEREREEGRREGLEVGREEGREEERVNTLREKARADAAENRADKLAEEILELKKQLESLMRK